MSRLSKITGGFYHPSTEPTGLENSQKSAVNQEDFDILNKQKDPSVVNSDTSTVFTFKPLTEILPDDEKKDESDDKTKSLHVVIDNTVQTEKNVPENTEAKNTEEVHLPSQELLDVLHEIDSTGKKFPLLHHDIKANEPIIVPILLQSISYYSGVLSKPEKTRILRILIKSGIIKPGQEHDSVSTESFKKGDRVRWTINGSIFTIRKVDGDFVFVEEHRKPIRIDTIEKIDEPTIDDHDQSMEGGGKRTVDDADADADAPITSVELHKPTQELIEMSSSEIDRIQKEIHNLETLSQNATGEALQLYRNEIEKRRARLLGESSWMDDQRISTNVRTKKDSDIIDADFHMLDQGREEGKLVKQVESINEFDDKPENQPPVPVTTSENQSGEKLSDTETTGPSSIIDNYYGPRATEEELEESIENSLRDARSTYATLLTEHKNKIRESKSRFQKIMDDLGVDISRKMPNIPMSAELLNAEEEYILAKKNRNFALFGKGEVKTRKTQDGNEESFFFNPEIINASEREYDILKKQIIDSLPQKERNMFQKGWKKWTDIPLPVRVGITSTLFGVGLGVGAGMGVFGVATYAGYRGLKALAGAKISTGVGFAFGKHYDNVNKKTHEGVLGEYGTAIDGGNFEEKERQLMRSFEKEEEIKKKQALKIGAAMAVSGGVSTALLGGVFKPSASSMVESGSPKMSGAIDNTKGAVRGVDGIAKPHVPTETPSVSKMAEVKIKPASVELSSRGFIQTFDDLKKKLIEEYGGVDKVPEKIKANILNKPSTELAQKFGFYDAQKGLSGMGLKGEHLAIDSDGDLVYEHLDKSKHVMFEGHTGNIHTFDGTMADTSQTAHVESTPKPFVAPDSLSRPHIDAPQVAEGDFTSTIDTQPDMPHLTPDIMGQQMTQTVEYANMKFNIANIADHGKVLLTPEGTQIGHEGVVGGMKRWILEPKFQDGDSFKGIRQAFNTITHGQLENMNIKGVTSRVFDFEKGSQIEIVKGFKPDNPNALTVLLNGKEVAEGAVTAKGPSLHLLKDIPKTGPFFADNIYERAFKSKELKKVLKEFVFTK